MCSQTVKDFEWLVVDDGSKDHVDVLVKKWQKTAPFSIRYIYKENGGKHTALNVGIQQIHSELTFIVDSDDCLTDDAVENILKIHRKYKMESSICGYVFLREFPDGRINGKQFKENELMASYIEVRINGDDLFADKAEVFKTQCLMEFPFPEYKGEKFLGEDLVWIRMACKYQMVHVNKPIYIGSYQEDGLTNNRRKRNIASPVGCMHRAEEFMRPQLKIKYRMRGALQYVVYGKFAGLNSHVLLRDNPHKLLIVMMTVPGMLIYYLWAWKYRKIKN